MQKAYEHKDTQGTKIISISQKYVRCIPINWCSLYVEKMFKKETV